MDSAAPLLIEGYSGATQVTAGGGSSFTCARFADGTARCRGNNGSGQLGDGNVLGVMWTPVVVATG